MTSVVTSGLSPYTAHVAVVVFDNGVGRTGPSLNLPFTTLQSRESSSYAHCTIRELFICGTRLKMLWKGIQNGDNLFGSLGLGLPTEWRHG